MKTVTSSLPQIDPNLKFAHQELAKVFTPARSAAENEQTLTAIEGLAESICLERCGTRSLLCDKCALEEFMNRLEGVL